MTPPPNQRAPGTGSLYQLSDGRRKGYWVGLYRVTDGTGKRQAKSVGDWDRDAAEAKLDALVAGVGLPATLVELRKVKAAAWQEGAEAIDDAVTRDTWYPPNPYD